jgi:predicted protein tyrosine phosphatase
MPAGKLYGAGGAHPQSIRDQLVQQYGEVSVNSAELSVVLDVMMITGMIKPAEFVDLMQRKLHRIDEQRRAVARLEADRG